MVMSHDQIYRRLHISRAIARPEGVHQMGMSSSMNHSSKILISLKQEVGHLSSNTNGSSSNNSNKSSRERRLKRIEDLSQRDIMVCRHNSDSMYLNTSYRRRSQGWREAERRILSSSSMSMCV